MRVLKKFNMKKKSLIVMLSILCFIVLVVVLSSTIFSLKNVNLIFYSNTIKLTNSEEIINSGNFKYNQSIFFLNKQNYINNLERNNPYLKVLNIETNFPNILTINAIERNEMFVVKTYQENTFKNYAILDDEFKILTTSSTFVNSNQNPILVSIDGYNYTSKNAGEFLINVEYDKYLQIISNELLAYNNNVLLLKANFAEIHLDFENKNNVLIKMHSGVEILLKDYTNRLESKFHLALSYYNSCSDTKKEQGRITVFENNEKQIEGYYYS